jgi:hypothetical protein
MGRACLFVRWSVAAAARRLRLRRRGRRRCPLPLTSAHLEQAAPLGPGDSRD